MSKVTKIMDLPDIRKMLFDLETNIRNSVTVTSNDYAQASWSQNQVSEVRQQIIDAFDKLQHELDDIVSRKCEGLFFQRDALQQEIKRLTKLTQDLADK